MSANMNENLTDENLRHEKIQAEIAHLMANTSKLNAEIEKIRPEMDKILTENKYYPFIVGSSLTLAIVALVKLFL
jgi:hypothetical protein